MRALHLHDCLPHLTILHRQECSPQCLLLLMLTDSSLICEEYQLCAQHLGAKGGPSASQLSDLYAACASVRLYHRHVVRVFHFEDIRLSQHIPPPHILRILHSRKHELPICFSCTFLHTLLEDQSEFCFRKDSNSIMRSLHVEYHGNLVASHVARPFFDIYSRHRLP